MMADGTEILKMIESVDPADTAKLDEIDAPFQYLDFLGFGGYAITPHGEVISFKRKSGPFKMAISPNSQGYKTVSLHHNSGDSHRKLVHRLVAYAYIPNPESKPFVCHKDGNRLHNWFENLYWGTHSENMDDLVRHGLLKGERNPRSVLTEKEVAALRIIYPLIAENMKTKFVNMFSVNPATIKRAISGDTWKS